ncbi:hypothetical protein [Metabacillus idriensis]|uniref:hypothetical protein n=1 Tax=Metabacillus idriensis TaxID=324768 RepID=UPI001CD2F437|nr:hypothetical protein [Metabacillus idriensis]
MNQPHAFGTFLKKKNLIFRESAYLQWGESEQSIGSFLLLNPGSASDQAVSQLNDGEKMKTQISLDPTMRQVTKLIETFYDGEQLNGRVNLYNLFTLQNTRDSEAIAQIEYWAGRGIVSQSEMEVSVSELKKNPWICMGWGVNDRSTYTFLKQLKRSWLNQIKRSGIPSFGKKNKNGDYYHVCPLVSTQREKMIEELHQLYLQEIKVSNSLPKIEFTAAATRPNIYLGPFYTYRDEDYGWTISRDNPERVIQSFSQLNIRKGFKLRAYQYSAGGNGNSVVWAIPHERELPPPEECMYSDEQSMEHPKPDFACENVMHAVDGDYSPLSYLQAAIAYHELGEFGAMWHGCYWSAEDILPLDEYEYKEAESVKDYLYTLDDWSEFKTIPTSLRPAFFFKNDRPTIVFYTKNDIGMIKLSRYTHTFEKESYVQKVDCEDLAFAGLGIIF